MLHCVVTVVLHTTLAASAAGVWLLDSSCKYNALKFKNQT